ncbi:MAG: HypC/HybG/HupF family hydrogenase formation chaperone [Rhodoferax sp.]|uniref:HypC/HybG/HupF family hydrogenase formation chaperone n=1 Tax=Rhodoferax sp. TaxID=50421 RepID=UPI001B770BCE|nr:HypC/HybG/HupF family hydrogenase formation chaperone [Rhodoferax sp.]MBP9905427.1 HypC/HybG/HupF family hydrogenase formation chaperone [Rhodoferax sp.]
MCIGIPMLVTATEPGFAQVSGRGEQRRITTTLIGDVCTGQWLLVFLNDARELLTPERAAEVNATLDLLAAAMGAGDVQDASADAAFALPSTMDIDTLRSLTGLQV